MRQPYLLPFVIAALVAVHIWAFHTTGNNNPTGVSVKNVKKDTLPFHPYYTVKDVVGVGVFLIFFCGVIFFVPTFGGLFLEKPNFEPANYLSTPQHIAPVWYFTAFYAMLRAVPDQQMGALLMLLAIVVLREPRNSAS